VNFISWFQFLFSRKLFLLFLESFVRLVKQLLVYGIRHDIIGFQVFVLVVAKSVGCPPRLAEIPPYGKIHLRQFVGGVGVFLSVNRNFFFIAVVWVEKSLMNCPSYERNRQICNERICWLSSFCLAENSSHIFMKREVKWTCNSTKTTITTGKMNLSDFENEIPPKEIYLSGVFLF
jgi:hypothetical protein